MYEIRKLYLSFLADTTRPNIRVSSQGLFVDRYYGYSFGTRNISKRYSTTEQYHTNYVHLETGGYQQLADSLLAAYIAILTE
jgi:hypothetical protein